MHVRVTPSQLCIRTANVQGLPARAPLIAQSEPLVSSPADLQRPASVTGSGDLLPTQRLGYWSPASRVKSQKGGSTNVRTSRFARIGRVIFKWRLLVDDGPKARHTFSQPGLFIAATALQHGLTVVSRDVADYTKARVASFNPWVDSAPIRHQS